ncbi:hypothetical protein BaRGS_00024969, partial [Batillaria attramentaria]
QAKGGNLYDSSMAPSEAGVTSLDLGTRHGPDFDQSRSPRLYDNYTIESLSHYVELNQKDHFATPVCGGGVSLGQFCAAVFQCGGHMPPFCNGVVGKTERSSVSRGRPASCKGKDLTSNAGQFDLPSEILRMYCAFLLAMGEEITAEHICYDGN